MGKNTSEGLQIRMRNPFFFPQPTNIHALCIQNNGLNEIVLLSNVFKCDNSFEHSGYSKEPSH